MIGATLNRRILVQRKTVTQDAVYGNDVVTWGPLAAEDGSPVVPILFWAELQDVMPSRSEAVRQGLPVARRLTRVRMRWRDDIEADMRVVIDPDGAAQVYQIVAGPAEIGGRKRMIEMMIERYSTGESA